MNPKFKTGFTMVELLIVIGIMVIVVSAGASLYSSLQTSTEINELAAQIVQNVRLAQGQSQSGLNNNEHGVQFEPHRYILYQGASYALRDVAYDRIFDVGEALTLSTTIVDNDVHFLTGLGLPVNPGSIGTITIVHAVNGSRFISVNSLGVVVEE